MTTVHRTKPGFPSLPHGIFIMREVGPGRRRNSASVELSGEGGSTPLPDRYGGAPLPLRRSGGSIQQVGFKLALPLGFAVQPVTEGQ